MKAHARHRVSDIAGQASVVLAALLFIAPHVAAITFIIWLYGQYH